jgi:hypothetical protein
MNIAVTIALIAVLVFVGADYMDRKEREDARWEDRWQGRAEAWMQAHRVEHETSLFWDNPGFQLHRKIWWANVQFTRMYLYVIMHGIELEKGER